MRTIRTVMSLLMAWNFIAAIQRGEPLWHIALMGLASLCFWPWSRETRADEPAPMGEDAPAAGAIDKAKTNYARIQSAMNQIHDPALAAQLKRLQSISEKMARYLQKHPERVPAASHFIDYYQDRTAALAHQYLSLRETGVQPQAVENLRQEMTATFQGFESAYEKQFEKLVEDDFLDMNAELKAARQMMASDGIECKPAEAPAIEGKAPATLPAGKPQPEKPVPATARPRMEKSPSDAHKAGKWSLKQKGMVAGAALLGAVGLYKLLNDEDE